MKSSEITETGLFAQKPLRKSVGFWLGIFVTLSLSWVWWDSARAATGAGRSIPGDFVGVQVVNCSIEVFGIKGLSPTGWEFARYRPAGNPPKIRFRELMWGKWALKEKADLLGMRSILSVPLWFVWVIWIFFWFWGLLLYRLRLRRREPPEICVDRSRKP